MKTKKIVSLILGSMLAVSSLAACSTGNPGDTTAATSGDQPVATDGGNQIVDFTMFAAMAGNAESRVDEVHEAIAGLLVAEAVGVRLQLVPSPLGPVVLILDLLEGLALDRGPRAPLRLLGDA